MPARALLTLLLAGWALPAAAQSVPLAPLRESGQTVTPAFEGWYRNADGSYSLSFGYYNRNGQEILNIPIGPQNSIAPGGPDRGQPSRFFPRRHWGVFAVTVPADFGLQKVVWTLIVRRDTFSIPASLKPGWEIDALEGEAGSGNTPPVLRFDSAGPGGSGPRGITTGPLSVLVGKPLTLSLWAVDDGKAVGSIASGGREGVPVTLTWMLHQGSGEVSFSNPTPAVDRANGKATTTATFSSPGDYVLRVRANDASGLANAGHAQCCWTNGFVKVTVKP
jgi:PKD domain-containing protein